MEIGKNITWLKKFLTLWISSTQILKKFHFTVHPHFCKSLVANFREKYYQIWKIAACEWNFSHIWGLTQSQTCSRRLYWDSQGVVARGYSIDSTSNTFSSTNLSGGQTSKMIFAKEWVFDISSITMYWSTFHTRSLWVRRKQICSFTYILHNYN